MTSSNPELSFLFSLTNGKKLRVFFLPGNPLDGILPNLVGILSLYLETIYIAKGSVISQVIKHLGNLLLLELGGNKLTAPIPVTFGLL